MANERLAIKLNPSDTIKLIVFISVFLFINDKLGKAYRVLKFRIHLPVELGKLKVLSR